MKAVLISIRPEWCKWILNGEKTIEVRKTRPKLEIPFRCYIYCTKGSDALWILNAEGRKMFPQKPSDCINAKKVAGAHMGNGKVIGEFVCDKMYYIAHSIYPHDPLVFEQVDTLYRPDVIHETRLGEAEIEDYLNGNDGYGWHISDLKIYDTPRELREFTGLRDTRFGAEPVSITRPPQSWCYVEEV